MSLLCDVDASLSLALYIYSQCMILLKVVQLKSMGEAQEQLAQITTGHEGKKAISPETQDGGHQSPVSKLARYKWWLQMLIFTFFVLAGQSVATLLGRLYFDKGGNSKWMATLVQIAGFPVLIPLFFIYGTKVQTEENTHTRKPFPLTLASLYSFLGIVGASNCMLYTIGLQYLPVSTFSLICATQLAFNALFSYFLNAQKFTPFIINSLVLLTISSTLLVCQNDQDKTTKTSKKKYAIGFICTVAASAGYSFTLSLTQFAFKKILKPQTFRVVFEMIIYQSAVATLAILIGFFATGEWKTISAEMEGFRLGKVSYVMTLVWTALSWQVFGIGCVGLIFEVSSLFSNVISTLGLPIVPVLAVVFFHDKMNGVKVISMLLAIWGFTSYIYQHCLDDLNSKAEVRSANEVSLTERA